MVTSVLTVLLVISSSLFVWGVDTISQSSLVRALDLNIAALEAACVSTLIYIIVHDNTIGPCICTFKLVVYVICWHTLFFIIFDVVLK